MRYFWKDGQVYAFSDLQIQQNLHNGLTELTPEELDIHLAPSVEVPDSITRRQCRRYLYDLGLLEAIESYIELDPLAQIDWETATVIDRDNPLVAQLGAMMGWNSEQLDSMFIDASHI